MGGRRGVGGRLLKELSGRIRGCELKCGNSIPVLGKHFFPREWWNDGTGVTQVGCGICIPGDTQSLSGHSCDLIGTTLSRELDEITSRDHFQQWIISWFYHTLYEYSLTFCFLLMFILYFSFQFNCTALLIFVVVNLFLQRGWSESMNTSNSEGIHILSSASTKSVSGSSSCIFFIFFF